MGYVLGVCGDGAENFLEGFASAVASWGPPSEFITVDGAGSCAPAQAYATANAIKCCVLKLEQAGENKKPGPQQVADNLVQCADRVLLFSSRNGLWENYVQTKALQLGKPLVNWGDVQEPECGALPSAPPMQKMATAFSKHADGPKTPEPIVDTMSSAFLDTGYVLAISGSRNLKDQTKFNNGIAHALARWGIPGVIATGDGKDGADKMAREYAREVKIRLEVFRADWNGLGRAAGPARNASLAARGDRLLAFPSPDGKGTQDIIAKMEKAGKACLVVSESPHVPSPWHGEQARRGLHFNCKQY